MARLELLAPHSAFAAMDAGGGGGEGFCFGVWLQCSEYLLKGFVFLGFPFVDPLIRKAFVGAYFLLRLLAILGCQRFHS